MNSLAARFLAYLLPRTMSGGLGNDQINVHDGTGGDTANGGFGTNTCTVDAGDTTTSC